jgi:hypothetical protein
MIIIVLLSVVTEIIQAVEYDAQVNGLYGIAIGSDAIARKDDVIAIGANCQNTSEYATAIGYGAQATGYCGMSIGINCLNTTDYLTAVGYSAQSGVGSTILGYSPKQQEYLQLL